MPAEPYRFHLHSLEEIDIACRIWGPAGARAMLGAPPARAGRSWLALSSPSADDEAQRGARERGGFGWLRLRRAQHGTRAASC